MFFIFSISSETSRFLTATVAAFDISANGQSRNITAHNVTTRFWQRMSRRKGLHVFWALNAENVFLRFKAKE
jgi:hypothetical protein